ncbi:hypothetical protein D3C87_256720 [compost metagenome]
MKKFVKVLLFILAFQMEVRVRASGEVIEQPSACLKTQDICAMQVTSKVFHFEKSEVKLHAKEGAGLSRVSFQHWKLLKGALWVEQGKHLKVETLYGNFEAPLGAYWLIEQGDRVLVRNIDADLNIELRDGKRISVPEGFEVWIAGINSKGQSEYGMIRPVDMKEHIPMWAAMFKGSKEEFLKQVQHLKENWGDLVAKSSDIYQKSVDRQVASAAEKAKKEQERKAQAEAERRRIRELFYQRTFER